MINHCCVTLMRYLFLLEDCNETLLYFSEVNKTISDEILAVIRKAISEYSFITSDDDARIITGEEEGAFSWITSNYVEGTFHVVSVITCA